MVELLMLLFVSGIAGTGLANLFIFSLGLDDEGLDVSIFNALGKRIDLGTARAIQKGRKVRLKLYYLLTCPVCLGTHVSMIMFILLALVFQPQYTLLFFIAPAFHIIINKLCAF